MKSKINIIISCMLAISLMLVGCAKDADENEVTDKGNYHGKEGKITIYLSGPEQMLNKLESEFENENGDVLDLVILGCGPLRQKVWTEKQAGQIQADVVWGSDPLLYHALQKEGDLDKYTPEEYDKVKDEYKVGDNYYTIVNERYAIIAYNNEKLKDDNVPASFEDLKKETYKGTVVMANANYSSTALAITSGLYQMSDNNWDYIKALKENKLFFAKSNGQVPSKIQEGEFDVGIAPHDSILRLQTKAKKEGYKMPVDICWPEEGALKIQRPVAIIKDDSRPSANKEIAEKFVDFLISKKAQNITVGMGFISVREDLSLPKGIPTNINTRDIDWGYAYENESLLRDGVKEIMGQ
ncbi:putative 2-aminoethylphosphonate ABC transporter substrate-binding protein [Vallitalea longa]|uniref:2-aminoethylphosphonate ABC transporter substrate-binding protein n=1 Tax=Vallitalea longa TaxID=2936439 RepID=A0A9W6DFC2_9FIRM|nr:extracellular solute-binding protein [Vallitalea longa]GKX31066.1 putative 2-aminoethylphosphonate ABC transporter substrate-binding protein [Vallitalea longa]